MATARQSNEFTNETQGMTKSSTTFDSLDALIISRNTMTVIEKFEQDTNDSEDTGCCTGHNNACCSCLGRWWNIRFHHQRRIVHIVEKTAFHLAIIILVIIDCLLVISELLLDFISLNERCGNNHTRTIRSSDNKENPKLELAIEILHYSSLILLGIFVVEVLIKIYAFGRQWWNIREKKMEWLDAIVVIASFVIDIYFMNNSNALAELTLLFISFRLWRIIRIINSVVQSVRSQDENAKKHLATTYLQVVELILNVSEKKTEVTAELRRDLTTNNFDRITEKFTVIDRACRAILEHCPRPSSRDAVTDIAQHLQKALDQVRLTSSTLGLSNNQSPDHVRH